MRHRNLPWEDLGSADFTASTTCRKREYLFGAKPDYFSCFKSLLRYIVCCWKFSIAVFAGFDVWIRDRGAVV